MKKWTGFVIGAFMLIVHVAAAHANLTGVDFHNGIDQQYVAVVTLDNGSVDSVSVPTGTGVVNYRASTGRSVASVSIFGTVVPVTATGCDYPILDHVHHAGWFLATNTTIGDFWTCMN